MREKIEALYQQISDQFHSTPLVFNQELSQLTSCSLYLKLENEQITGSFKLRGALSKFFSLKALHGELPVVVAASTGNHAAAVCHAAKKYHCRPIIFVPANVSPFKLSKLKATSAEIQIAGKQSGETEILAAQYASENQIPLIHPYNDPEVIAGQGTIGVELLEQLPELEVVFVPVGGGGLISGIANYLKSVKPQLEVIGVQPANASEMADSIEAGFIVDASTKTTISDGTAGGLDPQSITYKYCRDLVDTFIRVSEAEIVHSMRLLNDLANLQVEPAAALALAGIVKSAQLVRGKKCIAIVCGGNIQSQQFEKLLSIT